MVKKSVTLLIIFFALLLSFSACTAVSYNAEFYKDAEVWLNEDFIAQNRTAFAFYGDDYSLQTDGSLPKSRFFVIDDASKTEPVFNDSFDLDIDFGSDMLVLYTFTSSANQSDTYLKSVKLSDGLLSIEYAYPVKCGIGDATMPFQHWFLVKMDKFEVNSIEFSED